MARECAEVAVASRDCQTIHEIDLTVRRRRRGRRRKEKGKKKRVG